MNRRDFIKLCGAAIICPMPSLAEKQNSVSGTLNYYNKIWAIEYDEAVYDDGANEVTKYSRRFPRPRIYNQIEFETFHPIGAALGEEIIVESPDLGRKKYRIWRIEERPFVEHAKFKLRE